MRPDDAYIVSISEDDKTLFVVEACKECAAHMRVDIKSPHQNRQKGFKE